MANRFYNKGLNRVLSGDLDWDAHDIRVILIDLAGYTPDTAVHEFLADVPAGARLAQVALPSRTVGVSGVGAGDAGDVVFTAVPAITGGGAAEVLVYYRFVTADADSPLIALVDTAPGLPVTPNGGDIRLQFAPEGVVAV
ncbi:MAG: hypothetical protein M3R38_25770 [Actinomycetota bacterium]|nr:hypothetical protein [Actinomycetota bacterium]